MEGKEGKNLEDLIAEKIGRKEALSMKDDIGTTKYLVHAKIEASGVVERPDVVGAIFGQTEGLLGDALDLRELLKSSRIGRIKVDISSAHGKSSGTIIIPSSLDKVETAIIAAALETIDRVGPCEATIKVERIEDVRGAKRKFVVDRAKEILGQIEAVATESQEISEMVKEHVHVDEITDYEGLPAGPGVRDSDAIIIVEGRADVLALLRCGIKNAVAIEGTSVPKVVADLSRNKTATAFLDGDRGGDLILKELLQVTEVDFVARAPPGKMVEEMTRKEIVKALRNKVPADQAVLETKGKPEEAAPKPEARGENDFVKLNAVINELRGTLKARLLKNNLETLEEVQVRDLADSLSKAAGVTAVAFDGVVTQKLVDIAVDKNVKYLVGMRVRLDRAPPASLKILTPDDLRRRPR